MDVALKPSADAKLAVKVLEKVMKDYPEVDTKRVYITGLAQGGFSQASSSIDRPCCAA
ncbi:hypothetical protein [Caballeronia sordidicola]|uniref:Uncharacterized protein n=1 Tax=Caballeronia sordidicola TaxID=196367 RepID=A0A242MD74_CABSO|nr:hypothetical protein [Caballeronia sordidicola]OTP69247.1 hypothetical protein PAMC26577_31390 [Caballeronia sordidicola]